MENSLVVKHNYLIQARYNLSLNEQKVILYAASKLNRNQEAFNYVELDINEFTDLLDTKGKRYEEIRDITRDLRKKEIIINTDDSEYIAGWVSSITFYKNTGKIKLRFDDDLVPYLLQLKEQFTRYQLRNVLFLKNKYSIRIYELMKQYQKIGKRTFELQKFKTILMIDKQYDRIYDLERYVLVPSVKEINKHTDINIDYEKIKTGRKVTEILFKIESKDHEQQIYIDYLNEYYNTKELKVKMGVDSENYDAKQIIALYEKSIEKTQDGLDPFEYIRLNYLYIKGKESVRTTYGYLMAALEEDYAAAAGQLTLLNMV